MVCWVQWVLYPFLKFLIAPFFIGNLFFVGFRIEPSSILQQKQIKEHGQVDTIICVYDEF